MKGLTTLIKLHKRTLDDLRRDMASLESQKQQLLDTSKKLSEELAREIEMAGKQPEMANFFGGFAKRIKTRQEKLADEVKTLDKKILKLNEKIVEAFGELKKYEITEVNIKKRERAEANRRETIQIDEVAGIQHERRRKEPK